MTSLITRIMQDVRKNLHTGNFDDPNIKILCYDVFTLVHPSESNKIYIAYTSPNILYQFDLYSTMAKITLDVSKEPFFIAVRDFEYTEESLFQYSMINDIGDLTLEEINVIVGMCRLINP